MPKKCETCTPKRRNCTPESFVANLQAEQERRPLVDDFMGVVGKDGILRSFTEDEQRQLGIKHFETSDVKLTDKWMPLSGTPDHCPLRIGFFLKDQPPSISPGP